MPRRDPPQERGGHPDDAFTFVLICMFVAFALLLVCALVK